MVRDITERKKAEEELREINLRFENIFNNASDAIFIHDMEGRFLEVNQAACERLGYSHDEMLQKSPMEIDVPEFAGLAEKRFRDSEQKGNLTFESARRRNDGTAVPVEINSRIIDYEGQPCIISIARDITKRKKAESALLESEAKFAKAFQSAPLLMTITSVDDGRFLDVNDAFVSLTGYSRDLAIGSTSTEIGFAGSEDRDRMMDILKAEGRVQDLELSVTRADGSEMTCLYSAEIVDIQGHKRLLSTAIDITDRKKAEKALQESEGKFRTLVDQTADMLLLHDMEGNILEVNQASINQYGYSREELLSMKVAHLDPDYSERENGGAFWDRFNLNESYRFEARQKRKDGTIFPVEVTLTKILIGNEQYVMGLCRDISEFRRAEEEKSRLEQQYNQAQKLESIGRLAGGVAHDLNNLLSPILGYSEMLLEDTAGNDPRVEPLKEIADAGLRAKNLVRQLLAFSRKQALEFKLVDLNTLLKNFEKLLRRTIREDITINYNLSASLPPIKGDIGQLEQVIMNLAVNAQDAMPDGGELTIETEPIELDENYAAERQGVTPGRYVMLAFSDSGHGMDAETRKHLFEPFYTTKDKDKGTGLGLSTVYGIVKQHGGNIWTYSEPGLGAIFKIYLPVTGESPHNVNLAVEGRAELRGAETVLLVEDNEQVRKLAYSILNRQGYKILIAGSGEEALDKLSRHDGPVHLLLTDVIMPRMNGKQLFEKAAFSFPRIRVLYMSGYTDNVIAHHGVLDEGVNYIQKPFTVNDLAAKVREVLDGKD